MTITASPETDLAVAKACGIEIRKIDEWGRPLVDMQGTDYGTACVNPNGGPPIQFISIIPFRPSADLNDAFLAAEKFGLWRHREGPVFYGQGASFYIDGVNSQNELSAPIACASTPALAICQAILALAEKP